MHGANHFFPGIAGISASDYPGGTILKSSREMRECNDPHENTLLKPQI